MKKIKKTLRLLIFICLIALACLGIGISGGIPLPLSQNRRDSEKAPTELVDNQDKISASKQSQIKE